MARPRSSELRDKQFNLSLTARELERIKHRAQALGMRPIYFARTILLDSERKISGKREAENNLARLIHSQLVRLGNNLNQLVRHLHQTGDPLPADLEPLLNDIRQIINRVPQ
jgi:hypothetical protein